MISFQDIARLAGRIAAQFSPERIILFGSYAYGMPAEDSDVDLLVIMPFEGRSFRKAVEITCAVHPTFPVDIIARKPNDVERRYQQGDPLIGEALDKGKVLYEQRSARVD